VSAIVTLTLNPTVDKSSSVEQVLPERKLRCGPPSYQPGGGGINVARAVHDLGGDAQALWTRGGAVGDLLAGLLDEEVVPHEPVAIREMTRQNLIVYEQSSGQQYRFGMPGPELRPEEAEHCLERVRELAPSPDYLILSGSLPRGLPDDFYATVSRAAAAGTRIVVDTSGEPLARAIDAPVFLLKPNVRELGHLAGKQVEGDAEIHEVARRLIDQGKAEVIVTSLGSGGAMLSTAERHEHVRAPTVKIRSKVGAGDSMVAGIVHGLSQGKSIREAVRLGVAAGAAAVITPGTQLCRRADVERLYADLTREDQEAT
jgi:6-phosphofructokinase 2